MVTIVGLLLGVTLLFFWLSAHWFARMLAFLLLAAVTGFFAAVWVAAFNGPAAGTWAATVCTIAAWFISGIPLYIARRRHASMAVALRYGVWLL